MTRYYATPEGNIPFTAEEEAELDAMQAAWDAGADDRNAAIVRSQRDNLLSKTDWRASSDLTMSDEWRTYRQALRDITSQEGFPNDITWPTEPS